jgi:sugar phosphate isomerase/epimerase
MQFGICAPVEASGAIKSAGWDFVEEFIQPTLEGTLADDEWRGLARAQGSALPVLAANSMVPAAMKVTGPKADLNVLRDYMSRVIPRAAKIGMKHLVFGSGGARNIPDGFDRADARDQILDFLRAIVPIAQREKVTIVVEPLNKKECNILNSVKEAMVYVREIDHPNIQCLVDSYHLWTDDEPLKNVERAMPWIKHVHVADKDGRVPPGESRTSDYRPLFAILKKGKYDGVISVESPGFDEAGIKEKGRRVLEFLKEQWERAS